MEKYMVAMMLEAMLFFETEYIPTQPIDEPPKEAP